MFHFRKQQRKQEKKKEGEGKEYQIPSLHRTNIKMTPGMERELKRREQEEWLRSQL